jgi:prepilin-type N-terminal cleavage/methylation domain-containing protein/prepilin-type processing-associated H-X9-DG protein
MQRTRQAFTLIELLVVISIIVLLISILLPSLSAARESTKKVMCSARLKQLGLAFYMYTDEYNGYMPGYTIIQPSAWWDVLDEYLTFVHDEAMLSDASHFDELDDPYVCPVADKTATGQLYNGSYRYNNYQLWLPYRNINSLKKPGEILCVFEGTTYRPQYQDGSMFGWPYDLYAYGLYDNRHPQRANALFCDASVRSDILPVLPPAPGVAAEDGQLTYANWAELP